MLRSILIFVALVSVVGILASQVFLTYALLKKDAKITTRQAGLWIMGFLMLLTLSVTILMAIPPQG